MTRLAGYSGKQIRRVAEELGWTYLRTRGDHAVYKKVGIRDNLSIPDHRSVAHGTLRTLIRKMDISVDEFIRLAKK